MYSFSETLAEQLFRLKKTVTKDSSCGDDLLDESDESHYDEVPQHNESNNAQKDSSDPITEMEDQEEFDALAAVMNGNFRDHSLTRPVHSNIENTAFVAVVRPDGHTQVISKQTICWFLEGVVWKVSSDRKWRFKSCPPSFFQRKLTIKNVAKVTLVKGNWAVFVTTDGTDFLIGKF